MSDLFWGIKEWLQKKLKLSAPLQQLSQQPASDSFSGNKAEPKS